METTATATTATMTTETETVVTCCETCTKHYEEINTYILNVKNFDYISSNEDYSVKLLSESRLIVLCRCQPYAQILAKLTDLFGSFEKNIFEKYKGTKAHPTFVQHAFEGYVTKLQMVHNEDEFVNCIAKMPCYIRAETTKQLATEKDFIEYMNMKRLIEKNVTDVEKSWRTKDEENAKLQAENDALREKLENLKKIMTVTLACGQ